MADVGIFTTVKDSGKREEWSTGSRRDTREGKGRFDLIPPYFETRLAQHYENGAVKYGDRNWEKGQPLSRYLDSAKRHLNAILDGKTDEDHPAAVAWNAAAYMCTKHWIEIGKLPRALDDLGHCAPIATANQGVKTMPVNSLPGSDKWIPSDHQPDRRPTWRT